MLEEYLNKEALRKSAEARRFESRSYVSDIFKALELFNTSVASPRQQEYRCAVARPNQLSLILRLRSCIERRPAYFDSHDINLEWIIALITRDESWKKIWKHVTKTDRDSTKSETSVIRRVALRRSVVRNVAGVGERFIVAM